MRTPILGVALASIVTTDLGHQNATAVLVKPHGISDVAKLEKRWRALTALPWCRNVDHLVFIELARAPPSRVALINKTMDGRAKFIDVSSEFVPEVARRTSNVSCPSNPTSNYFSFGYKAMCRFWYGRAWHYLADYSFVLRVDDDCYLQRGAWPNHPGGPVTPVVYQGMDAHAVTIGMTQLFGLEQLTDSAVWDRHKRVWLENRRGTWNSPYTNVMLVNVRWARDNPAQRWFNRVDATGCVFRNRWGDLPLWGATMAAMGIPRYTLSGWAYTHGSHGRHCACDVRGPAERGSNVCVLPLGDVVKEGRVSALPRPSVPPSAAASPNVKSPIDEPLIVLNVAYCRPSLFQEAFSRAFPGREVRVLAPEDPGHEDAEIAIIGHRMSFNHDAKWQLKAYRALRNKKMQHVITIRTTILKSNPDQLRNLYVPWGAQQYDPLRLRHRPGGNRTGFLAYLNRDCRRHRDLLFSLLRPDGAVQLGSCGGVPGHHGRIPGRVSKAYEPYRFAMAMENSYAPGYLTEKIGMAFEGGAVPLFWGDSGVAAAIFNPDAYIDVGQYASAEAAAAAVRSISLNETRYQRLRRAPPFREIDDHWCFSNKALAICIGDAIRKVIEPQANVTPTGCCVDPPDPMRPKWSLR